MRCSTMPTPGASPTWATYRQKARTQLGTVGSGNHYVDLLRDEDGFVWIGVHFGSRGLGHTSATRYLKAAGGKDGMNVPPAVIDEDSELGRRYIAAMELAGRYSYAGREWVVERVRQIIGGNVTDMVHNHHNYAWRETHGGAICGWFARARRRRFPASAASSAARWATTPSSSRASTARRRSAALYSTVHGAGRLFGRKEAEAAVHRAREMDAWLQRARRARWSARDLDESPMAYRRLPEVLAEHAGTVRCCTRCGRSPWRWRARTSSIRSRIEPKNGAGSVDVEPAPYFDLSHNRSELQAFLGRRDEWRTI